MTHHFNPCFFFFFFFFGVTRGIIYIYIYIFFFWWKRGIILNICCSTIKEFWTLSKDNELVIIGNKISYKIIILELHRTQVGKCISTLRLTSLNINVKGLKCPEVNFSQCYFPLILSKGPQAFRWEFVLGKIGLFGCVV